MTVTPTMTAVPLTLAELETLAATTISEIKQVAVTAGTPPVIDVDTIRSRLEAIIPKIARLKIILTALDDARSCCRERTPSHVYRW